MGEVHRYGRVVDNRSEMWLTFSGNVATCSSFAMVYTLSCCAASMRLVRKIKYDIGIAGTPCKNPSGTRRSRYQKLPAKLDHKVTKN
jgi:NADH:ubiquinone oxidoreductase subunit B-like Fe-S oxidoreductase